MTALLARLVTLWKSYGPVVSGFARRHWRGLSVCVVAIVAALAMRGCAGERLRANRAEATAKAERTQLQAQFDGALASVRGLSAALASRIDHEGVPVAVFSGSSGRQIVPKKPAAPDMPSPGPADMAGSSSHPPVVTGLSNETKPPDPLQTPICVLAVGSEYEFKLAGAEVKRKDGGHLLVADVALDADGGLHLSGIVTAAVTLPPQDAPPDLAPHLPSGWGFGATGILNDRGWGAGPALALPPLRFLGFEVNATLGATFGPSGATASATTTVRR